MHYATPKLKCCQTEKKNSHIVCGLNLDDESDETHANFLISVGALLLPFLSFALSFQFTENGFRRIGD